MAWTSQQVFGPIEIAGNGRIEKGSIVHVSPEPWSYAALWRCRSSKRGPATITVDIEAGDGGDISFLCVDQSLQTPVAPEFSVTPTTSSQQVLIDVPEIEHVAALILRKGPRLATPARVRVGTPMLTVKANLEPASKPERRDDRLIRILDLSYREEAQIRQAITRYEPSEIRDALSDDPWLCNYLVNLWETESQAIELTSYPTGVALPIADICNARCTFCSSWLEGTKLMNPDQLKPYLEVLPFARMIGLQGHGEPLANPHIRTILHRIGEVVDRRASGYIITNGAYLSEHMDALLASRITIFNVSLNAVTPSTHDTVMGLGPDALPGILDAIRRLVRLRDTVHADLQVTISMVLTADNIHEAARFVELGNEMRVTRIYLRTLMPMSHPDSPIGVVLGYHRQAPIMHPEFSSHAAAARAAIAKSRVDIEAFPETWSTDVIPPQYREEFASNPPPVVKREAALKDKAIRDDVRSYKTDLRGAGGLVEDVDDLQENPYNRSAPFKCNFVYNQLITTKLTFEMYPCCYMPVVPGHERLVLSSDKPFMSYWNSPAMKNVRRRLKEGPLFQACAKCPMQG